MLPNIPLLLIGSSILIYLTTTKYYTKITQQLAWDHFTHKITTQLLHESHHSTLYHLYKQNNSHINLFLTMGDNYIKYKNPILHKLFGDTQQTYGHLLVNQELPPILNLTESSEQLDLRRQILDIRNTEINNLQEDLRLNRNTHTLRPRLNTLEQQRHILETNPTTDTLRQLLTNSHNQTPSLEEEFFGRNQKSNF